VLGGFQVISVPTVSCLCDQMNYLFFVTLNVSRCGWLTAEQGRRVTWVGQPGTSVTVEPTGESLQHRPRLDDFRRTFYKASWQDMYIK